MVRPENIKRISKQNKGDINDQKWCLEEKNHKKLGLPFETKDINEHDAEHDS